MKSIYLTAILISLVTITNGQRMQPFDICYCPVSKIVRLPHGTDGAFPDVSKNRNLPSWAFQDSLQAERFFTDSIGNQYMVEYKYWDAYIDSEAVKKSKSNLTLPYRCFIRIAQRVINTTTPTVQ